MTVNIKYGADIGFRIGERVNYQEEDMIGCVAFESPKIVDGVAIKLRAARVGFERAGSGSQPLRRPVDYHKAEGRRRRLGGNGALAKRMTSEEGRELIGNRSAVPGRLVL